MIARFFNKHELILNKNLSSVYYRNRFSISPLLEWKSEAHVFIRKVFTAAAHLSLHIACRWRGQKGAPPLSHTREQTLHCASIAHPHAFCMDMQPLKSSDQLFICSRCWYYNFCCCCEANFRNLTVSGGERKKCTHRQACIYFEAY